jgi:acyl transferase domain-containing protein
VNFCQGRMLSPDGHCKTFDASADGYARGEGCGVLLLKRLSDAIADGDRLLALIRGSALNQDGRSAGLTAPNGLAQAAVIRKALANAGLPPDAIDYIEAHGTGTALGDPIEMHALKSVFAGRARPLYAGSVKTNIGHTEAAAGVAGLIKAVQMLRHQTLPPTLHFRQLNPHIELGDVDIRVPTELTAAPLRVIGVSSFGFSGTNAHVVLERADARAWPDRTHESWRRNQAAGQISSTPLFISARTEPALRALIARYRAYLESTEDDFADICHTAATGRARFAWWVCVDDAAGLAGAIPANTPPPSLPPSMGRKVRLPTVAFQRQRCWIDGPADAPITPADPCSVAAWRCRLLLRQAGRPRYLRGIRRLVSLRNIVLAALGLCPPRVS